MIDDDNDDTIKCNRCFERTRLEKIRVVDFKNKEDDNGRVVLEDVKHLCQSCYEIVKYAASPSHARTRSLT